MAFGGTPRGRGGFGDRGRGGSRGAPRGGRGGGRGTFWSFQKPSVQMRKFLCSVESVEQLLTSAQAASAVIVADVEASAIEAEVGEVHHEVEAVIEEEAGSPVSEVAPKWSSSHTDIQASSSLAEAKKIS